ncbi:MAG TPA: exosome complex protein Rrp42 [Patescibacteria group bacterium]|nr:exosome complex protein Rrp42 [Patescibacteria group bacterium]
METPKITADRIKEYLSETGKRFDGRKADEFREITIETGFAKNAEGSARVKIGKTEVIAGIKMDVGTPYPDSKDKGNLMVNAELLPLSYGKFEMGPPKFPAIELARIIDRGIRESKFIKLDKLCIKEGEKVWTVMIDIYSLNYDGNLLDAAGIAAVAALKTAKVPKYDEKEEKVLYGEPSKESIPVEKDIPISLTVHKIGNSLIVDPTAEEEEISEARVTIASSNGVVYSMQKGELKELEIEEFYKILDLVEKTEREVFKRIEKHIK